MKEGEMEEYLKAAVQARSPSAVCLNEAQAMAFYSGQLSDSEMDAIRNHLAECAKCLALASEARQFLRAMRQPIPVGTHLSRFLHAAHRRKPFLLAASVLIVVSLGLLLWRGWRVEAPAERSAGTPSPPSTTTPLPPATSWRDLKIAKADYTPARPDDLIYRDEGTETPGAPRLSPFARAMREYERNNFAEAERRLAQFLQRNPDYGEAHFYRGVSLLLLGRDADAIAPLEAAVTRGQGRAREEAHWYLAMAYLRTNEPLKAIEQLDAVVAVHGPHQAEADNLRRQVVSALGQEKPK